MWKDILWSVYYIKMKCTDRLDSLNKLLETVSPFIKLDKAKQFSSRRIGNL